MNLFASTSKPTNKVEAGRKTAALRVRQRQKRESLKWSPSGKLRTRSQTKCSPTTQNRIPWNDRFIFDDGSQPKGATQPKHSRTYDEKENIANSNSSSNRIRHYTERSDGVAVAHFQQIEISTNSGAAESPSVVETRSIALSPFNMAKVQATLRENRLSELKSPQEVESILDEFEELILTMEIEEELIRRDLELQRMRVKNKIETEDDRGAYNRDREVNEN